MAANIANNPEVGRGKSSVQVLKRSLPYEALREAPDCGHSHFYLVQFVPEQPLLCGLCFFRDGVEGEIPHRVHAYRVLAANGNPETSPKMISHLQLIMGLIPPKEGESLAQYKRRRTSPSREQYTVRSPLPHHKLVQLPRMESFSRPAPGLFPVTTALWKLMGVQPPLGRVLVDGVNGRREAEIARRLDTSALDIYIRMAKAIRVAVGFIPNEGNHAPNPEPRAGGQEEARAS